MKRRPWIIVIVVLAIMAGVGTLAFKRYKAWKEAGHEEAGAAYSALAVCLVGGPEPLLPEEASAYASRLHESAEDPTIAECIPLRDKLVQSRYMRYEMGDLAQWAESLDLGPFSARPSWNLGVLFTLGAALPWNPPTHINGKPIPKPMHVAINSQINRSLEAPLSFYAKELDTRVDRYLPNQVVVAVDGQFDIAVADTPEKPLSRAIRIEKPKRQPREPSPPEEAKEHPALWLENTFFWVERDRFYTKQPQETKAQVVKLPEGSSTSRIQSCRAPNRRVFGLELRQVEKVALVAFQNQTLVPVGIADLSAHKPLPPGMGGYASSWTMSCDDEVVRITWAGAEQSGPSIVNASGDSTPPKGGFQNIRVETCSKGTCTRRETRIQLSIGNLGAVNGGPITLVMLAPEAYAIGDRILLMWSEDHAYRYRFAPIDELATARNEFLAQYHGYPGIGEGGHSISAAKVRVLPRGNVALASVVFDQTGRNSVIVARFDAAGNMGVVPVVEEK